MVAEDMLFATLDPTLRGVALPHGGRIILSDTVGFISDLPTMLIKAFRATLEEVLEADVILHVRDIAQPCRHPVYEVLTFARAREAPRNDDFAERHRQRSVIILEMKGDFGEVHRSAGRRALEDHFIHFRAAQQPRSLFPEDPAYSVGDIRLAAAVRPDDRGDARLEDQIRGVRERLEAMELELGEPH